MDGSPDAGVRRWSEFLVGTLPGLAAAALGVWRATVAAAELTPEEWLEMSPKRRRVVAPLPDRAEEALERRLADLRRMRAPGGVAEDLWLLHGDDEGWPREAMRTLGSNAPEWLVGWGARGLLRRPLVAVVGSREAPAQALQVAEILARSLVALDQGVVSGGARGVDHAAHAAALAAGGCSVFVLAEGLAAAPDFEARDSLDPERAALVSALWPTQRWSTSEALRRNQLTVALAAAVVVVAAQSSGGSLRTGMASLDAGRPTLAVDFGEITVHTAGNHRLLKSGATPLPAAAFAEGHAPDELRTVLGLAARPRPDTGDLFEEMEP